MAPTVLVFRHPSVPSRARANGGSGAPPAAGRGGPTAAPTPGGRPSTRTTTSSERERDIESSSAVERLHQLQHLVEAVGQEVGVVARQTHRRLDAQDVAVEPAAPQQEP